MRARSRKVISVIKILWKSAKKPKVRTVLKTSKDGSQKGKGTAWGGGGGGVGCGGAWGGAGGVGVRCTNVR